MNLMRALRARVVPVWLSFALVVTVATITESISLWLPSWHSAMRAFFIVFGVLVIALGALDLYRKR